MYTYIHTYIHTCTHTHHKCICASTSYIYAYTKKTKQGNEDTDNMLDFIPSRAINELVTECVHTYIDIHIYVYCIVLLLLLLLLVLS